MKTFLLIAAAAVSLQAAPKVATFHATNEFKIKPPAGSKSIRIWLAMPQQETAQKVRDLKIDAPVAHRIETDSEGNKVVFIEVTEPKEFTISETFTVTRHEENSNAAKKKARALSASEREQYARHLKANQNVIIDDRIKTLSAKIVGDEKDTVVAARKLYDWTLENIDYWVKDPAHKKASPVGSTEYCLTTKTGNCTDFHSLWTSLARAAGIPTRMVYGSFFKKELDGQDADQSYHCWPEFYAGGIGWVPIDVAVADIFVGDFSTNTENEKLVRLTTADGYTGADKRKVDYYFGNLEERRVAWSRGRDLTLSPKQDAGPVNMLAKAYIEVDGKPAAEKEVWTRKLTFHQVK